MNEYTPAIVGVPVISPVGGIGPSPGGSAPSTIVAMNDPAQLGFTDPSYG